MNKYLWFNHQALLTLLVLNKHVCKLHRSIYGLRQAPRALFQSFSSAFVALGFSCSRADPSMFIWRSSFEIVILLLYVNDIILTGSSLAVLRSLISRLSSQFSMKDLVGVLLDLSSQGFANKRFLKSARNRGQHFSSASAGFDLFWYTETHVVQPSRKAAKHKFS